jgi:hypothetical protein
METLKRKSFSRYDWYDAYYDGDMMYGEESYDEDSQQLGGLFDYWGFQIDKDNKGYIEDFSDDWYVAVYNRNTEVKNTINLINKE